MMKNIISFIYPVLFLMPFLGFSQGQANNWYFGENAGLTFNSGIPQPLFDGELNTNEGCATVSDGQGNLLFYVGSEATDAVDPDAHVLSVWNSNHQIMPNGTNLFGSSTSTQAAIIVPNPDNPDIYYIFTVDGLFPGETDTNDLQGFNYTVVDMSLDGGSGDVVPAEKNINLLPVSSEKVTAVRNADCNSIWVITHYIDTFYAYLVDGAGVNNVPVTSMVMPDVPLIGYRDNALGYLKASPDGTRLAIAHSTLNSDPADDPQSPGALWLYDFDPATGIVSGESELNINANTPYGLEFSPDSGKLYATIGVYSGPLFDHSEVYQYDLGAADISASLVVVSNSGSAAGALQLGPDSRIYRVISGSSFLDVINNPEVAGPGCNYSSASISLGGRLGRFGLPPFIQSLFNNRIDIIDGGGLITTALTICEGEVFTLNAEDIPGATYVWTRDGVPLGEIDFDLDITQAGLYQVEIDPNNGECPIIGEAVVTVDASPVANNTTLIQCDDDIADGLSIFNLNEAIPQITGGAADVVVSFHINMADAQAGVSALNPNGYNNNVNGQIVYVRVYDTQTGCHAVAELTLQVDFNMANNAILNTCDVDGTLDGLHTFNLSDADSSILFGLPAGYTVTYYATTNDALLEVNQLGDDYTNVSPYSENIKARVENGPDCFDIANVLLIVNDPPPIAEDEEVIYCLNDFPNTITLTSGFLVGTQFDYTYEWSTGEVTESIEVNAPAIYEVTITNFDNCSSTRLITVTASNVATIESVEITDFNENNTVTVNVSGEGDYEYALNNDLGPYQDSNLFENVPAGFHTVYVRDKNNCGINLQDIAVVGYPKFFTPNSDGINDTWQLSGTNELFQPTSRIAIFDRYGKLLAQISPNSSWDGTYNGSPMPSSDYWFRIQLEDGREFKGHFALKR